MVRLETFIAELLKCLHARAVDFCILRNHEGLPQVNVAGDTDILIATDHVETAVACLSSIPETTVTGIVGRSSEWHVFIDGVNWRDGMRALQIDLFTSLNWKGFPYLDTGQVLARSSPAHPRSLLRIPDPCDEEMITLMASYLPGAEIKERYQAKVRSTFGANRSYMESLFRPFVRADVAKELVSAVIDDDPQLRARLRPHVLTGVVRHAFAVRPFQTMKSVARYYWGEALIRFTPKCLEEIHLVGGSTAVKTELARCLARSMRSMEKEISIKHAVEVLRLPPAAEAAPASGRSRFRASSLVLSALRLRLRRRVPLHRNKGCWIWATSPLELMDPARPHGSELRPFARWLLCSAVFDPRIGSLDGIPG